MIVGDNVLFDEKERTIEKVLPRTNRLVRPPVANVDCALIFVAPSPEPDLFLADKILLNCFRQDVSPLFVVNKRIFPTTLLRQNKVQLFVCGDGILRERFDG